MSVLLTVPHSVDYCSFVVCFEIRKCESSNLVFFLKIVLTVGGLLCFHTNFKIICSSSVKNAFGILIEIALNLLIAWGRDRKSVV